MFHNDEHLQPLPSMAGASFAARAAWPFNGSHFFFIFRLCPSKKMSFHSSQTTPTGISSVSLRYLQRLETIQNTAMPETILAGQTVDTNAPELFPEFTFRSDTHQTNRFISSGIAYETTSRQSQHKSSITKDQQANDSDSIDEHHPGPLTRAIFTTPSRKRSHMAESIFDAHGTSSSFCTSSRPKVPSIDSIVTGALFNDDSVKSDFIFKAPKVPESLSSDREASPLKSRLIEENSSINFPQTLADDNFTTVNDNENMETLREVQQDMEENDMIEPVESAEDLLNSILNASVGLERCRNQQLEKTIMNEGKLNMSTLYCKRYAADAYRNVLKDYYTPIRFDDWNNIVEEMIENQLMEPNLDYIPITTEGEPYKTVMIGDPDQEIVCENRFDCGDILESVEEIEESFDGTRKLITSTPNENPNNTRKSISSSPLRAVSGSDKTDEVRGSYRNFIERLARGDDGTNDSHPPLMLPNGHDQQTSNVQLLTEDQRNSPSEYDFLCFNLDEIATGYQMSPEMEAVLKSQDPVHALQVPSQANPM